MPPVHRGRDEKRGEQDREAGALGAGRREPEHRRRGMKRLAQEHQHIADRVTRQVTARTITALLSAAIVIRDP